MQRFLILFAAISWATCHGSTSFYYYSQSDRIQSLEALYKTTKDRYSLWEIKNANIGVDGDKLFQEAIKFEQSLADLEDPVKKAKSNLDFHDRVRKLIAGFKDTHFSARANVSIPKMTSGLKTELYHEDNKRLVLVSAISKKIMELNKTLGGHSEVDQIKVGHQVVAIDGIKVDQLISTYEEYSAGSSPGFRTSVATNSLASRSFLYPEKTYSLWTFHNGEKEYRVRLPWYFDKPKRRDVELYLRAKGYKSLEKAYFSWDESKQKWNESKELEFKGYNFRDAPKGIIGETEWIRGKDDVLIRTGYFIKNSKSYGYIQFFAFNGSSIRTKGENPKTSNLVDVFRDFVKELKAKEVPLIVDIRVNFGGNTILAIENLSSIAKVGESYPSRTIGYRMSQTMTSLFNSIIIDPSIAAVPTFSDWELVQKEFDYAHSINQKYSNVILQSDPITANGDVGGYDEEVVVLLSPWCISACDNQSFLFKHSKRTTIIGEPANGTGAGFLSTGSQSTTYIDPLMIISTRIPNYLFGLPIVSNERVIEDEDHSLLFENNSENKATQPDIEFKSTKNTYLNKSEEWIEKAIEVIDSGTQAITVP
ncbi:MAG: S41 family peptidase [Bacteriovoracaceae bacterium]